MVVVKDAKAVQFAEHNCSANSPHGAIAPCVHKKFVVNCYELVSNDLEIDT